MKMKKIKQSRTLKSRKNIYIKQAEKERKKQTNKGTNKQKCFVDICGALIKLGMGIIFKDCFQVVIWTL